MLSQGAFAKHIGVTKQAVQQAVKSGRLQAFDENGTPLSADYRGRKFFDPESGALAFKTGRARVDDRFADEIAGGNSGSNSPGKTLVDAKAEKEQLQAELLKLKLGRERGELVSRQAQLDAFETAGRNVARQFQTMTTWAEEISGVARSGGVPALTAWLRAKSIECCTKLAGVLADDAGEAGDDADGTDATE